MATAYTNQTLFPNQPYTLNGVNYAPFACDISKLVASFSGFVINDTVNLVRIPNRYMLVDFLVDYCALDSSTGVVTSLGDNGDSSHGGAGAGGFVAGLTLGRSSLTGQVRPGTLGVTSTPAAAAGTAWVHGAIPWIYSVPVANEPSGGLYFMMKVTTAPTGTAATTGTIYGWIAYTALAPLENGSGTGAVQPL